MDKQDKKDKKKPLSLNGSDYVKKEVNPSKEKKKKIEVFEDITLENPEPTTDFYQSEYMVNYFQQINAIVQRRYEIHQMSEQLPDFEKNFYNGLSWGEKEAFVKLYFEDKDSKESDE